MSENEPNSPANAKVSEWLALRQLSNWQTAWRASHSLDRLVYQVLRNHDNDDSK
ncbi:MAG: hypothetical protein O2960_26680 [Verrucomicrobia bacterium]|nr:hypothetical protein [Verrucomicrobiota bacterium]